MKELRIFRGMLLVILAYLAGSFTDPAHALTFDFSFTGTPFSSCNGSPSNCVNGPVTGTISGLSNGTSAGVVELTSFPSALIGLTTALDTPIAWSSEDNFTVTAGVLTHADFISANSELSLKTLTDGTTCFSCFLQAFSATPELTDAAETITITPEVSAVPLPASLPLFAGGLGLIGLYARLRKRKSDFAAQCMVAWASHFESFAWSFSASNTSPSDYAFPSIANSRSIALASECAWEPPSWVVLLPMSVCTVTIPAATLYDAVIVRPSNVMVTSPAIGAGPFDMASSRQLGGLESRITIAPFRKVSRSPVYCATAASKAACATEMLDVAAWAASSPWANFRGDLFYQINFYVCCWKKAKRWSLVKSLHVAAPVDQIVQWPKRARAEMDFEVVCPRKGKIKIIISDTPPINKEIESVRVEKLHVRGIAEGMRASEMWNADMERCALPHDAPNILQQRGIIDML
jgi:hypothetical protein